MNYSEELQLPLQGMQGQPLLSQPGTEFGNLDLFFPGKSLFPLGERRILGHWRLEFNGPFPPVQKFGNFWSFCFFQAPEVRTENGKFQHLNYYFLGNLPKKLFPLISCPHGWSLSPKLQNSLSQKIPIGCFYLGVHQNLDNLPKSRDFHGKLVTSKP